MPDATVLQLRELAQAFRDSGWRRKEQRVFVKAANELGYAGRSGGWIYRDGQSVTQGWQSLAMMLTGGTGRHVTSQARGRTRWESTWRR